MEQHTGQILPQSNGQTCCLQFNGLFVPLFLKIQKKIFPEK